MTICLYNEDMTKKLKAVHQRPQDLILAMVVRDCLPKTQILREHVLKLGNWRFCFSIIGESHRVQITQDEHFVMEEMLACVDIPVQATQHYHPFHDLQAHDFVQSAYSVSVQISPDTSLWRSIPNEIAYTFPAIDGIEAVTRIQWQQKKSSIEWRTLHSYLDSGNVLCIYSQSNYNLQSEG